MKSYDNNQARLFPLQIRTTYADLLDRLQDFEANHVTASLSSCSLIVKRVGTGEYVYAQGRVADGTTRQVYIAPYDDAGKALLERFSRARAEGKIGDVGDRVDLLITLIVTVFFVVIKNYLTDKTAKEHMLF